MRTKSKGLRKERMSIREKKVWKKGGRGEEIWVVKSERYNREGKGGNKLRMTRFED